MAAVLAMTNCPTEETLAAFLDGHLDAEARMRVIEHLAECGECREIVLAAGEVEAEVGTVDPRIISFRPRIRYGWLGGIGVAAAAGILVLFLPPVQEEISFRRTGGLSAVHAAYKDRSLRPIESRLDGFAYRELEPVMRSVNEADELEMASLYEALSRIEGGDDKPSWRKLRAQAVAKLLLGNQEDAARSMESAVRLHPNAPTLLSDLAAVYVERARSTGRAEDAELALQAANRAWSLSQTPETAWNRALALERTGRNVEAQRAWDQYLKLDPSSPWSDEAHRNLQQLQSP